MLICFAAGALAALLAALTVMWTSKARRGRDGIAIALVIFVIGLGLTLFLAPIAGAVALSGAAVDPNIRLVQDAAGEGVIALVTATILFVPLYAGLALFGLLFVFASEDRRPGAAGRRG